MSAALRPSPPTSPPAVVIGAGTWARREAAKWRGVPAEAWLAQALACDTSDEADRRRKELNKERRARWTCAAKRIGADREDGEIDVTVADLRPGAPQAIHAANAHEPRRELPDIEGLRHRDPALWRKILQYLRGCPRARAIIWFLDAGIPRSEMAALMGISERAVNMAHATLRRRMEAMRRGEPVPAGRPEPPGAEFMPRTVPGPGQAADLFAARNVAAALQPTPKKQKARRRKTEKPAP